MESFSLAETASGKVRGRLTDGVHSFKGVRYGATTAGKNRFRPPQPAEPWAGVRDALDFGAPAPQLHSLSQPGLIELETRPESEDCLFLNVWTPSLQGRRPVMVWLHAGGYFMGSGSSAVNDGSALARNQDVVVVTLNHRLGIFGHLDLSVYGDEFAFGRNAGMLDIVQALQWVKTNIERFGGDPNCVTVFGESGGGWKVSILLAMSSASGLFHRACLQSGSRLRIDTRAAAAAKTARVLGQLNILPTEVHRIQQVDLADFQRLMPRFVLRPDEWQPVVDGVLIERQPFSPDAPECSKQIPVIVGTTRTENAYNLAPDRTMDHLTDTGLKMVLDELLPGRGEELFKLYRRHYPEKTRAEIVYLAHTDRTWYLDACLLADRKARQRSAPVFSYIFDRPSPVQGGRFFVPHTSELPFVFNTLDTMPQIVGPVTPRAQALADAVSAAWASFARDGVPRSPALPEWTTYQADERATMIFHEEGSKMVSNPRAEQLAFWQSIGSLQEI